MIVFWAGYNAYYFLPSHFRWGTSLPLQVCDLLGPVAAIAVGLGVRPARALLYFSAFTLASQAIITPTGNQDPAILRFWLYWVLHAGIVALSALDLIVLRFRPVLRDYLIVIVIDVVYTGVIVPLDQTLGSNYGFLGNAVPDTVTAINYFGPWPQRIFYMLATVIAVQGLFLIPWIIARRVSPTLKG